MEDHKRNDFKLVERGLYKNHEEKKKLDKEDFNKSLIPNVDYLIRLYDYCILDKLFNNNLININVLDKLFNNNLININVDLSKFSDENLSDQYIINSKYKRIRINETHNCDRMDPGKCIIKILGWVPTYKTVYVTSRENIYKKSSYNNIFYLKNPYYNNNITLDQLIKKYTKSFKIELIYNQLQILETNFNSCIKKKYFKDSIKEFSKKIKSLNKSN